MEVLESSLSTSYGNFPNTYGQATSFFQESGVQQEFAFVPSDGSATYVINVESNTTQTLKGPSLKDARATYFASKTALVQLSSSGNVSYLLYDPTSASANANTAWNVVSKLPVAVSASSSSSGAGSSKTTSGSSTSATGNASGSGSGNGASDIRIGLATIAVATVATLLAIAIGY